MQTTAVYRRLTLLLQIEGSAYEQIYTSCTETQYYFTLSTFLDSGICILCINIE